jgi:hypothetical protein
VEPNVPANRGTALTPRWPGQDRQAKEVDASYGKRTLTPVSGQHVMDGYSIGACRVSSASNIVHLSMDHEFSSSRRD